MNSVRPNIGLLFATRITRLFAYGFLSVILALYLAEFGLTAFQIGLLFTLTLVGDAVITLGITTYADRIGRRRMLVLGAVLMLLAGIVFLLTNNFIVLTFAAIIGIISPSGNDIGPFLSIEQASLSQLVSDKKRMNIFAWYNLAGSFATAAGALVGGWLIHGLQSHGTPTIVAYKVLILAYALSAIVLVLYFLFLSEEVEAMPAKSKEKKLFLGLHRSKKTVFKLALLFSLDAFAGGFILQSMFAYWFHVRFNVDAGLLGSIFFGANLLAGISALLAVPLAKRIGLINTMVFTHIPSNILLILVPLMPGLLPAIILLLFRYSISQMDVPTRQAYIMSAVAQDERSAAAGITAIARSIGASLSPALAGIFLGIPALLSLPFFLSGGLKITYDLLLYREFNKVK